MLKLLRLVGTVDVRLNAFPLLDGHESIDTKDCGLKSDVLLFQVDKNEVVMISIIVNLIGPRMAWDVSLWACL